MNEIRELGIQLSRGRVFLRARTVYMCLVGAEDSQKPLGLERSERGGEQEKMNLARELEGCIIKTTGRSLAFSLGSLWASEQQKNMI